MSGESGTAEGQLVIIGAGGISGNSLTFLLQQYQLKSSCNHAVLLQYGAGYTAL